MRIVTVVVGASCLLLMALFIALFAIVHDAAADTYDARTAVKIVQGK